MADTEEAAQAASQAAAATTEAIETIEENAENAIAAAQERVDDAERMARQITEAALATELGSQIRGTNERMEAWQTETSNQVMSLRQTVEGLETKLSESLSAITTLLQPSQPENPSSSTPQAQPENPAEEIVEEAAIVEPAQVLPGGAAVQEEAPIAVKRVRRFI